LSADKLDPEGIVFGDIRDSAEQMRKVLAVVAKQTRDARRDPGKFFEFVMRQEHTQERMVLAPHQKVMLDFIMYHDKCVLMLPVGHSKCTVHDTEIQDPETGVLRTIQQVVEGPQSHVLTLVDQSRVESVPISAKHDTGTKECLKVTLRNGRHIKITPEHPMLTPNGWLRGEQLRIGDTLASANRVPFATTPYQMGDHEVDLLAVLLSEGSTTHHVGFTTADAPILDIMRKAANILGCDVNQRSKYDHSLVGRYFHDRTAYDFCEKYGLMGKKAIHKTIPDAVFGLPEHQLARFLSVFWMCDGFVSNSNGPSVTLASEKMIRQIQHLLLKFSIQSRVCYRVAKCNGKSFDSWNLTVCGHSFENFAKLPLWGQKAERAQRFANRDRNPNRGIPVVTSQLVNEFFKKMADSGVSINAAKISIGWNGHGGKQDVVAKIEGDRFKFKPTLVKAMTALAGCTDYDWLWSEDIYWDEIVSIEDIGEQRVFDLTVNSTHCYIANDLVAHNTFSLAALGLWMLGHDPSMRGCIVSATESQASKPLGMIADYIARSNELKAVFPNLRPSPHAGHSWSQTKITIDRPMGIKDPSFVAVGYGTKTITGARLSFVLVDDLLNQENTESPEQRQNVYTWFDGTVLSRLDPKGSKVVVTNTAWHTRDLVHELCNLEPDPGTGAQRAWPTLKMSATGEIRIYNTDFGFEGRPGASDLRDGFPVRPGAKLLPDAYHSRLVAHDPDPRNEQTLFPIRFPKDVLEEIRLRHAHPIEFSRAYLNEVRNDADAWCKKEWIVAAKQRGQGILLASEYRGTDATFTGVDLAISPGEHADYCAFFTFRILPNGQRLILDIDIGRYDGPTIVQKIIEKGRAYNSVVRVENNACFQGGTLVLTKDGYRPIEEIQIGDEVWTHAKRWRKVTNTIQGTASMTTQVNGKGCIPVTTTPNHWFYMRQAGRTPGRSGGHMRPFGDPTWVSCGFADAPGYVHIAQPTWPSIDAQLDIPATRNTEARSVSVDERIAMVLGIYMAEGHSTKGQVFFTLNKTEEHLAEFIKDTLQPIVPDAAITFRLDGPTCRVIVNSTALARCFKAIGKRSTKTLPLVWLGWDSSLRLAAIRGWLMGDGCLRVNNKKTSPRAFFSGASISRNWMLWARTTLLDNGFRARLDLSTRITAEIEGRTVNRLPIYSLDLNAEDTIALRSLMNTHVENEHWEEVAPSTRRSNSPIVIDDTGTWAKFSAPIGGPFEREEMTVYNLEVEEDHSYVVEDMVVHNAQDFIRQFAIQMNSDVPIRAHTTGRTKGHPEHGVPAFFTELSQGAWIIPSNYDGSVSKNIQRFIDECLEYTPSAHTGDALMACWFGREQAKEWGMSWGNDVHTTGGGNLAAALMNR
jgi:intein/homing endonuclease